ncbi:hypothetical protein CEXT_103481 [Caerostris extrusa]|uniref:Uncharacterized protein n=1 Tax=Caerostris extrusa TaxID=172846 RepID=A0AAV4QYP3_CAEEX|nr:hypothetical protein CEXT_103481 [Caerostris extrusa]
MNLGRSSKAMDVIENNRKSQEAGKNGSSIKQGIQSSPFTRKHRARRRNRQSRNTGTEIREISQGLVYEFFHENKCSKNAERVLLPFGAF